MRVDLDVISTQCECSDGDESVKISKNRKPAVAPRVAVLMTPYHEMSISPDTAQP